MPGMKNGQISQYCCFNNIIKEPGTSFQSIYISREKDITFSSN